MTKAKQTPAEVVEPQGLVLSPLPVIPEIEANFEALDALVDKIAADYVGAIIEDEYVPQAKKDTAFLNATYGELDSIRKTVKRHCMAPYERFDAKLKPIQAKLKGPAEAIREQIKAFEAREQEARRASLAEHWECCAGVLANVVPFERVEDPKWSLKSTSPASAKKAIEDRVEKIAADYEAVGEMDFEHIDGRAVFIETLDLSDTIARNKAAGESKARAAQLEAEVAEAESARKASLAEATPATPEPESVTPGPAPAQHPTAQEETFDWSVEFTGTVEQARAIAAYCKSIGLSGGRVVKR